jgi:hypothetical protein
MKTFVSIVAVMLAGSLLGCSMEERLEDVSHQPRFSKLIGVHCETSRVDAYGIRPYGARTGVGWIALIARPGIAGPEVEFERPLAPGSTITILKVYRSNRWPDPDLTFEVRLEGTIMPADAPVRIDVFGDNHGAGMAGLNPDFYRRCAAGA